MSKLLTIMLAVVAAIAVPAHAARRGDADAELRKLLAGRVAGEPVNCITLSAVTSSRIIDGRAIVYRVGGRLYVNEPRAGASRLDEDDVLVTRSFGSQLCSVDSVHLVDRTSRFPRGFVLLGKFVPYSRPKRAN